MKLTVFTNNNVTLGHELFLAGNVGILKTVFLELHPQSVADWEADVVEGRSFRLYDRACHVRVSETVHVSDGARMPD